MAKQKITSNLALRGIFYFQILQNLFTKELIYSKGQPYATKKYYGQFDFLIISVSLDADSDTEYNHSGLMPVLKDNYHQRFYLGQWGMSSANYIQINFLSDGTNNFTVDDNSAILNKIYGVKINN